MDVKAQLDELLSHEIDRKQFLSYLGATALTVVGVSSLLKAVTRDPRYPHRTHGYGSEAYGGSKPAHSTSSSPIKPKVG